MGSRRSLPQFSVERWTRFVIPQINLSLKKKKPLALVFGILVQVNKSLGYQAKASKLFL
jgi:hypothetical protein